MGCPPADGHTFEAAHQLLRMATEIARISAEPELRFNCLETIRPPAHYICARLDRTAAGASAAGEGHAQLAQSVQNELVLGYKAVVRDALAARRTDRYAEGSARQRDASRDGGSVVHAASNVRVLYRCTAPAWYELNQLYRLADELGIATNSYADEQSRGGGMLTIADVYLRIALLAIAKPNQLRQKDLSAVFNALDQWTPRIRSAHRRDDTLFVVDLDADAPPTYRELGSHAGKALRGISTDVLVYELEAYLAEMASDVPVPDYISLDLLRHLAHAWGMMKKRSFRRSRSSGHDEGLRRSCARCTTISPAASSSPNNSAPPKRCCAARSIRSSRAEQPARPATPATSGTPGSAGPKSRESEYRRSEPHSVVDAPSNRPKADRGELPVPRHRDRRYQSVRLLRALASQMPNQLQTGELLAIREREDARWCIAVSRWIRHSDQETLMGIELLAPRAIPVAVRMLQKRGSSPDYHRAVLLPALEAIGQPAMLITPRLPYNESQKVQLRRHRIQATGQLMRRVLMTESFTQFTFRMLDGYLENTQIDLNMDSLWNVIECRPVQAIPEGRVGSACVREEEVGKLSIDRDCDEVWPTLSPVRLLIADRSENRAHEIDSVLRNAGIPTRSEFCADLSEISDPEQPIDLLLCRSHFDHLEQVLPALRKLKPNLPIIVMDDSPEPKNLTRGLAMGATDVIFNNDNERLLYVVKRELENVCQRTASRRRNARCRRRNGAANCCSRTRRLPSRTCTKACTSTPTTTTSSCSASKTSTNCWGCRCST